jgi:Gram-negative bacterial TonB protein C-terminal
MMPPLSLNIAPGYSRPTIKPFAIRGAECRFHFATVDGGLFALRGMLWSLLVHAAILSAVLTWPFLPALQRPRPIRQWAVTRLTPDLLSAPLSEPPVSEMPAMRRPAGVASGSGAIPRKSGSDAGTVYIGVQKIVSNPPHPTNHIQTILQPDLPNLPIQEIFLPLPNLMIQTPALRDPSAAQITPVRVPRPSRPASARRAVSALEIPPLPLPTSRLSDAEIISLPLPTDLVLPAPTQTQLPASPAQTTGSDGKGDRNVLVLSPASVPPGQATVLPAGEARGQFVQETPSENVAVRGQTAPGVTVASNSAAGASEKTGLTPSSGGNRGLAGKGAFPGIVIQGGERSPMPSVARHSQLPGEARMQSSYDLTIVSSGNSGGGLADFGIFLNEPVFTVYIEMTNSAGHALSPWVLQYAFVGASESLRDTLAPPLPQNKVLPDWPSELVDRFAGEMIVIHALIAADGKVHDVHVLQSPHTPLNQSLLEALDQWTFRPAIMDGQPVAVKALLGVPVVPYD